MTTHDVEIAIIGAGFSGLGAAIKLTQEGVDDYVLLDRGQDFGGTWRDNVYPGAACDVPSHLYSYSFALNPEWSRSYSHQPEIHRYINAVADEHGIGNKALFGSDVTQAAWDEDRGAWTIHYDRDGQSHTVTARTLVGGIGPLCEPNLPDIEGIEDFGGKMVHSAQWDTDYDFTGKRVAVIGTGASAIQIVPQLGKTAGHMDVYQRTAPWIIPRNERPYLGLENWAFKNVPGLQAAIRGGIYSFNEVVAAGMTYAPKALKPVEALSRANIFRGIRDPKLRKAVTPTFAVGCKRILKSNEWYPTLDQDNVELVTDGIARVTETGIVTNDGTARDVDVIVVATGFHVTDSPIFGAIVGSGGKSLAQVWEAEGMQAYKGSFVHGFPNLMLLVGPSTGLGHTSMVYMIESQLNYLVDYLRKTRSRGIVRTDVTKTAQDEYNRGLQHNLRNSVWVNGGCASWYKDRNGNVTALWPGFTFNYRNVTRSFDIAAYDVKTADQVGASAATTAEPVGADA
ncbi:NAD(P)/FAD-dependent oxidoreductase [Gordonia sp. (in: high G+C Gram-positive bacteria)]|uniref:flavin-containing monooxygenase n=1 Tax=Gordonia sp. (in: high G+C Gram-positive bacteria) TaxID=84139 RepID=UPI0016AD31DB|nr:NAD(P)/FAD-dependent oxidoreductase [Gordonia sp. (in: high G+C Gram-positive bacteria)]NLG47297.1 NAD(P)/FAD-dependent oxidoreductase [Gordonia sp. (in: high G+C Gram-positive bacteria)]